MVLKKLERLAQSGIQEDEVAQLKQLSDNLSKLNDADKARAIAILEEAREKATDPVKAAISELRAAIETKGYNFDSMLARVKDEHAKLFMELYQDTITEDLGTILGTEFEKLSSTAKESVKMVLWSKIVSATTLSGAAKIGGNLVQKTIGGIFGDVKGLFNGDTLKTEGETSDFEEKLKAAVAAQAEGIPGELKTEITKVADLVISIIGTEGANLDALLQLTTGKEKERKVIMENPKILEAVLQTGKYEQSGFKIDLAKKEIQVGVPTDAQKDQLQYMARLLARTEKIGGSIKGLQKVGKKLDALATKVGFTSFEDFKAELFAMSFPIGLFFKLILGGFTETLDKGKMFLKVKTLAEFKRAPKTVQFSIASLGGFTTKFAADKANEKHLLAQPNFFSLDFYVGAIPLLTKLHTAKVDIRGAEFWEKILTGKGANGGAEEMIYKRLKSALGNPATKESDLVKILNSITDEQIQAAVGVAPKAPEYVSSVDIAKFGKIEVQDSGKLLVIGATTYNLDKPVKGVRFDAPNLIIGLEDGSIIPIGTVLLTSLVAGKDTIEVGKEDAKLVLTKKAEAASVDPEVIYSNKVEFALNETKTVSLELSITDTTIKVGDHILTYKGGKITGLQVKEKQLWIQVEGKEIPLTHGDVKNMSEGKKTEISQDGVVLKFEKKAAPTKPKEVITFRESVEIGSDKTKVVTKASLLTVGDTQYTVQGGKLAGVGKKKTGELVISLVGGKTIEVTSNEFHKLQTRTPSQTLWTTDKNPISITLYKKESKVIEVVKAPSLQDQIIAIKSLPTNITLESGKTVRVRIVEAGKEISIAGKRYPISIQLQSGMELFDTFSFKGGKFYVTHYISATEKESKAIEPGVLAKIITELTSGKKYSHNKRFGKHDVTFSIG